MASKSELQEKLDLVSRLSSADSADGAGFGPQPRVKVGGSTNPSTAFLCRERHVSDVDGGSRDMVRSRGCCALLQ